MATHEVGATADGPDGAAAHLGLPNGTGISVSLFEGDTGRVHLRIESDDLTFDPWELADHSLLFTVESAEPSHITEARCARCGETFNPMDLLDYRHGTRENGDECGGLGVYVGEWNPPAPAITRDQVASVSALRKAYWTYRADILDMIAEGDLPETVQDMNDLHDETDGNALGGLLDEDAHGRPRYSYADSVIVQAYVDAWLAEGRPDGLPTVNDYLRGHLDEQGRTVDPTLVRPDDEED